MGLAFSSGDFMLLYADYLKHYPHAVHLQEPLLSHLSPYLGVGGIIVVSTSSRSKNDRLLGTSNGSIGLGIRVPIGIEWKLNNAPVSVFGEIAPGISIMPSTDMLVQAGLGIRYLF